MDQENLGRKLWRRYVLAVLVIVIVAVVAVLLVLHFDSSDKSSGSKSSTCSTKVINGKCQPKSTSSGGSANGPAPQASTPQSTTNTPSSSSSSTAGPTNNTSLSNTGPGDVVALFVGTAVLGSLSYYAYLSYKLRKADDS